MQIPLFLQWYMIYKGILDNGKVIMALQWEGVALNKDEAWDLLLDVFHMVKESLMAKTHKERPMKLPDG